MHFISLGLRHFGYKQGKKTTKTKNTLVLCFSPETASSVGMMLLYKLQQHILLPKLLIQPKLVKILLNSSRNMTGLRYDGRDRATTCSPVQGT